MRAAVHARLPHNARLHEAPKVVIEAIGYGVQRTVELTDLRPAASIVRPG